MKERQRPRKPVTVKKRLISFGVGLVLAVVMLVAGGVPEKGTEEFCEKICDAFTIPGILLTCIGLLYLVSDYGAFDGVSFTVRKAFGQVLSEKRREAMPKTYFDYVTARRDKKTRKSLSTLWAGLVFLVIACIFLVIYLAKYSV